MEDLRQLRKILNYNYCDGNFYWKVNRGGLAKKGTDACMEQAA
jgi:hypothetical protein